MKDFLVQAKQVSPGLPDSCQTCPQALRGGFCGAHIHPDCLRIEAGGLVCVSLSTPAAMWFEAIAQFGEVLHLMRNAVAEMGCFGRIPVINNWRNATLPCDSNRHYLPNLAEYASLWAFREALPMGACYGLEVRDDSGTAFERIMLTGASYELFTWFVAKHQSPTNWFTPKPTSSSGRHRRIANRLPQLQAQWAAGERQVRRLPARFMRKLLAGAVDAKLQLETRHYQSAAMRTATWTPQRSRVTTCVRGLPEFFQGDGVSLRLHRAAIAGVWLAKSQDACGSETRWTVEASDARNQVSLAIMAGRDTQESDWRELLKVTLPGRKAVAPKLAACPVPPL